MTEAVVSLFWTVAFAYSIVGLSFAIPFVLFWSGRLDPAAKAGTLGFRLAILPGTIAMWPWMALRTLRSFRQGTEHPNPEHHETASIQRRVHGAAFVSLAVALPMVCTLALLARPRDQLSTVSQLRPTPLPNVIPLEARMPSGLPVSATLRTDGTNDQIQLDASRSIDEPIVAVFWSRKTEPRGVPKDAIFLGSVWGPARLLFDLPLENHEEPGVLTFIALAGEQRVIATLRLNAK
jgi:hypothetical protein